MTCRLCDGPLAEESALRLPGMPSGAQSFLDQPHPLPPTVDLVVCACMRCGLVQLDNTPVPYWREVITAAGCSPEMATFRCVQAEEFVRRFGLRGSRVLEVGCGDGYYLDLLADAGAIPIGLEYGVAALERARQAGRPVQHGYITEAPLDLGIFDAFVCINFLEHAPQPGAFLQAIASHLTPSGVGLVEVPNLETVIHRRRFYDFVADHLSYFTAATLRFALEGNGFEVLECASAWHEDDLVVLVRRRPSADFHTWLAENPVLTAFKTLTDDPRYQRIAIWGASHQALTLIALAHPKRVECIIDSSPAKQGRYESVLGLPILPPERLDSSFDLVIVMAAGYSDEVVAMLTGKLRFGSAIAVLREKGFELVQSIGSSLPITIFA